MVNIAKQNQYVEFAEKDSKGRNIAGKIDELESKPVTKLYKHHIEYNGSAPQFIKSIYYYRAMQDYQSRITLNVSTLTFDIITTGEKSLFAENAEIVSAYMHAAVGTNPPAGLTVPVDVTGSTPTYKSIYYYFTLPCNISRGPSEMPYGYYDGSVDITSGVCTETITPL